MGLKIVTPDRRHAKCRSGTKAIDSQIPKMLFYGQLMKRQRAQGRPLKRYKDTLKTSLRSCGINTYSWEVIAQD